MGLPKAKADLTAATLALVPEPQGNGWFAKAQMAARARVAEMGLPVGRDEYWKYSDPRHWTDIDPKFDRATAQPALFSDNVTVIDVSAGVLPAELPNVDGMHIQTLADAADADIHWAAEICGVLETAGQKPVERPLAALTTALATDGLVIDVTGQVDQPLCLRFENTGGQANLHHIIRLAPGASLILIEEGDIASRSTSVIEVQVADGARFDHLRLSAPNADRQVLNHIFARLGEGSHFASFTLSLDGAATRNEAVIEILGDNASAHIAGAAIGSGDFHHDDTVFITHDAVDCESRQVFKKVLRNGATGVFQGKILVQPGAQKTDGYQISQSLLLDEDSQFLAKPELEIYADDVACSHGSTSGAIDEEALFYLRSRGVPQEKAQDLLVLAFLAEALDEIDNDTLGARVLELLQSWLGQD